MVHGIETLRAINDRAAAGPTPGSAEKFEEWAIVDVMGHQRYIGRVSEHVIAGQGFLRVDVPATEKQPRWTKLIGTGSIYAITPIDEQIAMAMVNQSHQAPLSAYELRHLGLPSRSHTLPEATRDPDEDYDDCFEDDQDYC